MQQVSWLQMVGGWPAEYSSASSRAGGLHSALHDPGPLSTGSAGVCRWIPLQLAHDAEHQSQQPCCRSGYGEQNPDTRARTKRTSLLSAARRISSRSGAVETKHALVGSA